MAHPDSEHTPINPDALLDAALVYVAAGFSVIPLHQVEYREDGTKRIKPWIRWVKDPGSLVTSAEQAARWFGPGRPAAGIAIATGPSGLLMVDLDDYKIGAESTPTYGAWIERGGRGGSHAYFRNPTGARNTAGLVATAVDTRGDGGLVVCSPTVCVFPDGTATTWTPDRPIAELLTAAMPDAPDAILIAAPRRRLSVVGQPIEITPDRAAVTVEQLRQAFMMSTFGGRHAAMIGYLPSLARYLMAQGQPVHDVSAALEAAVEQHPDAVAGDAFESAEKAISDALGYASAGPWVLVEPSDFEARFTSEPPPFGAASAAGKGALPTLAAQFWQARPVLAHLRDAAWSRRLSPDAVLHAVLARLAAGRRADLRIDSGIETSSLNYFAALIGVSGTGKSRAWRLAGELLELDDDDCPVRPLGSGEGVAEAFMGTIEQMDLNSDKNKTIKTRVQVRRNVLFELDEGQSLTAMLQRSGATIGPALRSAWSGAVLGQQNADSERNRRVSDYATGLVAGFQPDAVEALIGDTHTGMPQRFVYAAATDPSMPRQRPKHPGPLPVDLGGVLAGSATNPFTTSVEIGSGVTVPDAVTDEIDTLLFAVGTSAESPTNLDSQWVGSMLRMSGLLTLLDGRFEVTAEDWQLAGAMWQASAAVRDALVSRAADTAERTREAANQFNADKQVQAAAAVAAAPKAIVRCAARISAHVHTEGQLSRGEANRMLANRDRKFLESALEHASDVGWLIVGDLLIPGVSRPS